MWVVIRWSLVFALVATTAEAQSSDWEAVERARIQRHLSAVEARLRAVDMEHLSAEQRAARAAALDRLHEYWQAGVFPHNDYLNERTPIFIDREGRACAMGDLLIQTGYEDAAETIAAHENLARVVEIHSVDLTPWLDAHGLTLAEAQAIQPQYCWECDRDAEQPVCGSDGRIHRNYCVAICDDRVEVVHLCVDTPCICGADAGPVEPDAGVATPVSDDGCSTTGGGAAMGLPFLVLFVFRRRQG